MNLGTAIASEAFDQTANMESDASIMENPEKPKVAVIGEVLFDHFPDGRRVLGGAPFNVAWNLKGLEVDPIFLSCIGDDKDGGDILSQMHSWGLDSSGVRVHDALPTGSVAVTIGYDGEPAYEINRGVAYDALYSNHSMEAVDNATVEILYHGSLCFRTEVNRRYLQTMIDRLNVDRFVDLNIREPWIERSWLPLLIGDCRWLKLSADELAWLSGQDVNETDESSIRAAVTAVVQKGLSSSRTFLVTCGENGAYWIEDDRCIHAQATPIDDFVDSVGAGDAFTAATIRGLICGESPESILNNAVRFAARACTIQGATSADEAHYKTAINGAATSGSTNCS